MQSLFSPGQIKSAGVELLDITKSFDPSTDRNWVVPFWELPVKWIFVSLPFGLLVTLLFYFDVSHVLASDQSLAAFADACPPRTTSHQSWHSRVAFR